MCDGYLRRETEEGLGKESRCRWKIAGRVACGCAMAAYDGRVREPSGEEG